MKKGIITSRSEECFDTMVVKCPYCGENNYYSEQEFLPGEGDEEKCQYCKKRFEITEN